MSTTKPFPPSFPPSFLSYLFCAVPSNIFYFLMQVSPGDSSPTNEKTDADGAWNSHFLQDSVAMLSDRMSLRIAPGRDFAQTGNLFPFLEETGRDKKFASLSPHQLLTYHVHWHVICRTIHKHSNGMRATSSSCLVPIAGSSSSVLQASQWSMTGESELHGA